MARQESPPDIHDLFCHYNTLYFHDALGACVLSWSQSSSVFSPSCAGECDYFPGGCEILLSEHVLKRRSFADIKNTLLHEMIHAYLWITKRDNDHSNHGTNFQAFVKLINGNVIKDPQRPIGGYNIVLSHELDQNINDGDKLNHSVCESCGGAVVIPTMKKYVSANDSERNQGYAADNSPYHLHEGKKLCSNCFVKLEKARHSESTSKGEHKFDEQMSEGLQHTSGDRSKRICRRDEMEKFADKDNMAGKSPATIPGVQASSKVDSSVFVDPMEVNVCSEVDPEGLKRLEKDSDHMAHDVPKRERSQKSKNKPSGACLKKRKLEMSSCEPTVIIAWLNFFAYEESDEDSVPLLNKRSERRKRQKLLSSKDGIINPMDEASAPPGSSIDRKSNFSDNNLLDNKLDKSHTHSTSPMNEVDVDNEKIKAEACAGGVQQFDVAVAQVGEILSKSHIQSVSHQITSPLNSPARDDIVDISDGSDTGS